ncbi:MAG: DUF2934 domain-containing protein [Candidatus Omnitrophica bacterium]|jgi:hypothetical protein|nr:DUF2934 domain-containing protein [Candidatus Omnitrophota bacterium]
MCLEKLFYKEKDIKALAHRLYEERNREHGYDQDDWFKAKDTINSRVIAGLIYLAIGISLVTPLARCFFYVYWFEIFWCIGWTMLGAGVGLINTRNQSQGGWLHLVGYWGFIIVAVSIISFTVSLYASGNIYPYWDLDIKFYSLAASIGLIGGFLGYTFHELISKILANLRK